MTARFNKVSSTLCFFRMSCCACFVVLTGFAGAFKMPCSHLQAWQGRHHSSACVKCPSNCMCSGFVDLKLLDSEPLTTCALLFFCWDFSDESWHLLQFGVGIHSARRWERTNFAFGCEDNYECVCRMSEWKHVDWKLLDAEPTLPLILMSCIFSTLDLGFFWRFRRFLNSGTLPSHK